MIQNRYLRYLYYHLFRTFAGGLLVQEVPFGQLSGHRHRQELLDIFIFPKHDNLLKPHTILSDTGNFILCWLYCLGHLGYMLLKKIKLFILTR